MGIFGSIKHTLSRPAQGKCSTTCPYRQRDCPDEGIIVPVNQRLKKQRTVLVITMLVSPQIDTEQKRIDDILKRILPIDEQNQIIADARKGDETKVAPYMEQLKGLDAELSRLDATANDYEKKLGLVGQDTGIINEKVGVYQKQIDQINAEIEELQRLSKSGSQADIKKFQQTIGIRSDGLFGSDTAKRTREWKAANQQRIDELLVRLVTCAESGTITIILNVNVSEI